jgi:hypothetical protein
MRMSSGKGNERSELEGTGVKIRAKSSWESPRSNSALEDVDGW